MEPRRLDGSRVPEILAEISQEYAKLIYKVSQLGIRLPSFPAYSFATEGGLMIRGVIGAMGEGKEAVPSKIETIGKIGLGAVISPDCNPLSIYYQEQEDRKGTIHIPRLETLLKKYEI